MNALRQEDLIKYAQMLELDLNRFTTALDRREYRAVVERDRAEGIRLGVRNTPTFFINGKKVVSSHAITVLNNLIENGSSGVKAHNSQMTDLNSLDLLSNVNFSEIPMCYNR